MSGLIAGSYIVLAVTAAVSAIIAFAFARYYEDKYDRDRLSTITTIVGISICLTLAVVLPLDVLVVNWTTDNTTGLKRDWATPDVVASLTTNLKVMYYLLYSLVLVMTSTVVPFAYFYFEALDEDDANLQTWRTRAASALKFTVFSLAITFLLAILSLFIGLRDRDEKIDLGWFERLASMHGMERALTFLVGIVILLGQISFILYTAFGLSYLPISMIKGRGIPPQEVAEVERELAIAREKIRVIQAKYPAGRRAQGRDAQQLLELQRMERMLVRRQRIVEESSTGYWSYILSFIRPIEFVLGVLGMGLTIVIVLAMVLSLIDRLANTLCSKCGFIIDHSRIFNPIDLVLVRTSRFFPVDLIFFGLVVLWFMLSTISGVVRLGIRILWVKLFAIKKGSTAPQGLLLACVLLMISLMALQFGVSVLAPQYSAFGNQRFCNNTIVDPITNSTRRDCSEHPELIVPCAISAPGYICTPTVLSITIASITYNQPTTAWLLHLSQWIFCAAFTVGLVVAMVRRVRRGDWDVDEDDIDEEEEGLLASSSSRSIVQDASDAVQSTARRAVFGSWFG